MLGLRSLALGLLLAALPLTEAVPQTFNQRAIVNATGSGDQTAIAAVVGKQIWVYGFDISLAASTTVTLKCGSTAQTGPMTMNAWSKGVSGGPAYFVCASNTAFIINLGTSTTVAGIVWYNQQ